MAMSVSPGQAAAALDEIERTERRTRNAKGYAIASPHLILWGLVWMAGYGACAVLPPERWGLAWLPLVVVGSLGSSWLGSRAAAARGGKGGQFRRSLLMGASIFVFIACTYYVLQPRSPLAYLVFPALITGLAYSLSGAAAGMMRFVWIGGGIVLLTMAGYVLAPQWTALIVAVAAGGGLVLGGLWLRQA
jgi:hypothetical protein